MKKRDQGMRGEALCILMRASCFFFTLQRCLFSSTDERDSTRYSSSAEDLETNTAVIDEAEVERVKKLTKKVGVNILPNIYKGSPKKAELVLCLGDLLKGSRHSQSFSPTSSASDHANCLGRDKGCGGEGQYITSKGASKRKTDTNQTNLNQKDHTSWGPTGGNQTTTRTLGRGDGHPLPGPTTTSHHN